MRTPTFRELSAAECHALLARQSLGRLAFISAQRVDIEPIHYVFSDGWIFGRTSEGTKVRALEQRPWVAFEVDEVESPFDWRSVVVQGTIYFLSEEGSDLEQREFARALATLREQDPDALRQGDLTPHRTLLFGLHVDVMNGRAAQYETVRHHTSPSVVADARPRPEP